MTKRMRLEGEFAAAIKHGACRYGACISGASTTLYEKTMSKLPRGVAAGYGAKKLGGGCFSTVLIFILLWWLLGHFGIFR